MPLISSISQTHHFNHRISNPLRSWNPADIPTLVKAFAIEKRLLAADFLDDEGAAARQERLEQKEFIEDSDLKGRDGPIAVYILMMRAAEIASRGGRTNCSDEDKLAFEQEHDLLHQSASFYWTIVMVSLAAILQGWGRFNQTFPHLGCMIADRNTRSNRN